MRVLCLGNELVADDLFGWEAARQLRDCVLPDVEIIATSESGFYLLDYFLNTDRLVIIDAVVSGTALPGTIYLLHEHELRSSAGVSPHYVGMSETLAVARRLNLPVPSEVILLLVEVADCSTIGGGMHPAVRAAIPVVVNTIRNLVGQAAACTGK